MEKHKPTTPDRASRLPLGEELEQDIADHPDRGMLDGEPVVRFDSMELQFAIPKELYRVLLEIGAAKGFNKTQIFIDAFSQYVSSPGNIALAEHWQNLKAQKHGVTSFEIKSKVLGSYKRVARDRRRRIKPEL
jgi:hypothetical protein